MNAIFLEGKKIAPYLYVDRNSHQKLLPMCYFILAEFSYSAEMIWALKIWWVILFFKLKLAVSKLKKREFIFVERKGVGYKNYYRVNNYMISSYGFATSDESIYYMNMKPSYFNTGCCCFSDGDITGIEIDDGAIRLIKWTLKDGKPERQVLEETGFEELVMGL